jgi:hypothetical protein
VTTYSAAPGFTLPIWCLRLRLRLRLRPRLHLHLHLHLHRQPLLMARGFVGAHMSALRLAYNILPSYGTTMLLL